MLKVRWVFEKTVEFYQMLLRVVSKICFEFQQIILEYLHSVARNAKSFLFNLCDRNALSYHKSGYFRTITVLMHPFLQNWIDTKFAGYIEFFDKILEFLEKSLSFRDFLEFFRPWVFRFQRKRKPDLLTYVDTDMYRMRDAEAVRSRQDSLDFHFIYIFEEFNDTFNHNAKDR